MLFAIHLQAEVGGSVSGTVKDASNAVVPGATVKATNTDTGVQQHVITNGQGFYSFPDLPIGRYDLVIQRPGFKPYQRTGVAIDANSAVIVDVVLEIGELGAGGHSKRERRTRGNIRYADGRGHRRARKWPPFP